MSESSASTPAPPAPTPPAARPSMGTTGGAYAEREKGILENLKKIYDPEIPMNIVDLGLIYGFDWAGDDVTLHMTLTAPGCPVAGILAEEVKGAIEKVPNVHAATVDMVWEPPWTPERMSDFAKRQFGYL
jgi:metal-sulfur cluster biosynthetic enzyme